jgi:hypothetical protein
MAIYVQLSVQAFCAIASPMMTSDVTAAVGVYEDSMWHNQDQPDM